MIILDRVVQIGQRWGKIQILGASRPLIALTLVRIDHKRAFGRRDPIGLKIHRHRIIGGNARFVKGRFPAAWRDSVAVILQFVGGVHREHSVLRRLLQPEERGDGVPVCKNPRKGVHTPLKKIIVKGTGFVFIVHKSDLFWGHGEKNGVGGILDRHLHLIVFASILVVQKDRNRGDDLIAPDRRRGGKAVGRKTQGDGGILFFGICKRPRKIVLHVGCDRFAVPFDKGVGIKTNRELLGDHVQNDRSRAGVNVAQDAVLITRLDVGIGVNVIAPRLNNKAIGFIHKINGNVAAVRRADVMDKPHPNRRSVRMERSIRSLVAVIDRDRIQRIFGAERIVFRRSKNGGRKQAQTKDRRHRDEGTDQEDPFCIAKNFLHRFDYIIF